MAITKPLVTDLISTINHVPSNFIRPIGDRPDQLQLQSTVTDFISIIDLQGLNSSNRSEIIQKIEHACQNYGFFQVLIKPNTCC
jgi:hypothetical protein